MFLLTPIVTEYLGPCMSMAPIRAIQFVRLKMFALLFPSNSICLGLCFACVLCA